MEGGIFPRVISTAGGWYWIQYAALGRHIGFQYCQYAALGRHIGFNINPLPPANWISVLSICLYYNVNIIWAGQYWQNLHCNIVFPRGKRTLHRRTGQNNRAHEELASDNIIWRNALYFLDGHYVCLCVWLRDKSFEFFSNLSSIH